MIKNTIAQQKFNNTGIFEVVKYKNRKLYSLILSKYITLTDLLALHSEHGEKLVILHANTREDITQETLISAAVHKAGKSTHFRGILFNQITPILSAA